MIEIRQEVFQVHLAINYRDTGQSETYWLWARDWAEARLAALDVARARCLLLGNGAWCEWLDVRQPIYPAPCWPLMQGRITSLRRSNGSAYWDRPNDTTGGLYVYWRPEGKKGYTRFYRYLADSEFYDDEWIRRGIEVPAATPPVPGDFAAQSPEWLYQFAFGTLRDKTCLALRLDNLQDGTPQWELRRFRQVHFSKRGSVRARPQWFRVSWEAGDYNRAPHFSPCGCVVGVRRETYERDCVFYAGGEVNRIRFYYAQPDAKILPFPTIFHGWYGIEDITNPGGPGELDGRPITPWTPGFGWSMAPGLAPTGGPNSFLGLAVAPFDENEPTPENLLPGCDVPTPIPLLIENDAQDIIVPNGHRITVDGTIIRLQKISDTHARIYGVIPPATPPLPAELNAPYRVDAYTNTLPVSYSQTGNTITGTANGALPPVDGVSMLAGTIFLLDNGTPAAGIWQVTVAGDGSTPFEAQRVSDFDDSAKFRSGILLASTEGTTNGFYQYMMALLGPFVLNTDVPFFSRINNYTIGTVRRDHVVSWHENGNVQEAAATIDGAGTLTANGTIQANASIVFGTGIDPTPFTPRGVIEDTPSVGIGPGEADPLTPSDYPASLLGEGIEIAGKFGVRIVPQRDGSGSPFPGDGLTITTDADGDGVISIGQARLWVDNGVYFERGHTGTIGVNQRVRGGVVLPGSDGPAVTLALVLSLLP